MTSPVVLAGYLTIFILVGATFVFANLLLGRFLRPADPHAEKLEIYECGEPTIGSSFVQFDLRFYVIALIFIVFDAEVAFLYPLATVFGKASHVAQSDIELVEMNADRQAVLTEPARSVFREMGVSNPVLGEAATLSRNQAEQAARAGAAQIGWATFWAINIFFVVLLIGFAYEWRTGSLDWVRSVSRERASRTAIPSPISSVDEPSPALSV